MSTPTGLVRFLTAKQIMRLYQLKVMQSMPTQPSMLESAVSSPPNHKHYGQTDVFQLAGILAERIILNHSFQDGNKRIALLAADMFLKINGFELQKQPFANDNVNQGLKDAHVAVASNQWDAEKLAAYYQTVARPVGTITREILAYQAEAQEL